MPDAEDDKPKKAAKGDSEVRIDELDALIAYGRFAGLTPKQIAESTRSARLPSHPNGCTIPTIAQRIKAKKEFVTRFGRFAASVEANHHRVASEAEDDPDLWLDGAFLAQQALETQESESMFAERAPEVAAESD